MTSLSDLKRQLKENAQARNEAVDKHNRNVQLIEDTESKVVELMSRAIAREQTNQRALYERIEMQLNTMNDRIATNNGEIVDLNRILSDITHLTALYEAKRIELDTNYQESLKSLESSKNTLKSQIEDFEQKKKRIEADIKRLSLEKTLKSTFERGFSWVVLVFVILLIGGAFAGGVIAFFQWLFSAIGGLFSGIGG